MNVRLFFAERHIPVFIKKRELRNLLQLTAAAFAREAPVLNGFFFEDRLSEFASFTKMAVDQARNREEEIAAVKERLFHQGYKYGKLWRKRFGITTMTEVMRAGRVLYRAIGIEFRGTDQGRIEIGKCFFSRYYSPGTCEVLSALDAGIMAGLSEGKLLTFSRRITEGFDSCKAKLGMKESVA